MSDNHNPAANTSLQDILPEDHEFFTYIKKVLRHRCRQAGFRRISTRLIEGKSELEKVLGPRSVLAVKKSCAVLTQINSEDELFIRSHPEVGMARAYVEHKMDELAQPVELYSIDHFLSKTQEDVITNQTSFSVSVIGKNDPALDAQVIYLMYQILKDLGLIEFFNLHINHIGSEESRKLFQDDLRNFYFDKQRSMPEDALELYLKGEVFSLLSHPDEDMQILAQLAPKLENYLTPEDRERFQQLKEYLDELNVSYKINPGLFGKSMYQSNTIFEFFHNNSSAQESICYGGSNDSAIAALGGESTSIVGFSAGIQQLIVHMRAHGIRVPAKDNLQVFVAQLGHNAKKKALSLLQHLRESGIQAVGAMGTGSMRMQLDMASQFKVKYTLLMGEIEVKEGNVIVRDMSVGTQESVPYAKAVELMQQRVGKEKMDVMEENEKSVDLK